MLFYIDVLENDICDQVSQKKLFLFMVELMLVVMLRICSFLISKPTINL